ncbi:hypothetical protein BC332_08111 [Capsicum chinense]|nr:hypothetical protein BC332_08111 [Capsicum chinense]
MDFRLNFRELIETHKPALVVLLETHRDNHQSMPYEFHFSNIVAVPAEGQVGGISILWHVNLLNVTNVALTHQEIRCIIQVLPSPNKWLFLAIYVFNNASDRLMLWDNLKNVVDSMSGPWLIGGDFNEISKASEKFGGLAANWNRVNRFTDCLGYYRMLDLGFFVENIRGQTCVGIIGLFLSDLIDLQQILTG